MRYIAIATILMLICISAAYAGPTIYKCDVGGKVVYQGTECDASKASATKATAPSTLHNGTTDANSKEAFMCMTRDARKNNVPLSAESKKRADEIPAKEWWKLDCG